jgi:hypothetical protein
MKLKNYIQYIKENLDGDDDNLESEDEEDIDDGFITNDKFRQFLIDRNCLDKYVDNCHNLRNAWKGKKNFSEIFDKCDEENFINFAFNWDETPEGDPFWETLDDEWIDLNDF